MGGKKKGGEMQSKDWMNSAEGEISSGTVCGWICQDADLDLHSLCLCWDWLIHLDVNELMHRYVRKLIILGLKNCTIRQITCVWNDYIIRLATLWDSNVTSKWSIPACLMIQLKLTCRTVFLWKLQTLITEILHNVRILKKVKSK